MRRILMVESKRLLDEGTLALVQQEADLAVTVVKYLNKRQFLNEIVAVRPDVILLNENGPPGLPQVIDLVLQIPALTKTRIITYRIDDNLIRVLDYQRVLLAKGEDLVSLIHLNE